MCNHKLANWRVIQANLSDTQTNWSADFYYNNY